MRVSLKGCIWILGILTFQSCIVDGNDGILNCQPVKIILIADEPILQEDLSQLKPIIVDLAEPFDHQGDSSVQLFYVPILDIRSTGKTIEIPHILNISSVPTSIKKMAGTFECSDGVQDYQYWKSDGGHVDREDFLVPAKDSLYWDFNSHFDSRFDTSEYVYFSYLTLKNLPIVEIRELIKSNSSKSIVLYKNPGTADSAITEAMVVEDSVKVLIVRKNKNKDEPDLVNLPTELVINLHLDRITWTEGFNSYSVKIKRESTGEIIWKQQETNSTTLQIANLNSKFGDNTLYIIEIEGNTNGVIQTGEQKFWLIKNQTSIDPQCIKRNE
ncbi:MAG TPA: hypothetical protein DIW47_11960 [Bacteroidetes bacterium]|nr:hypothetical protein [Bacteroidota bacterium]